MNNLLCNILSYLFPWSMLNLEFGGKLRSWVDKCTELFLSFVYREVSRMKLFYKKLLRILEILKSVSYVKVFKTDLLHTNFIYV